MSLRITHTYPGFRVEGLENKLQYVILGWFEGTPDEYDTFAPNVNAHVLRRYDGAVVLIDVLATISEIEIWLLTIDDVNRIISSPDEHSELWHDNVADDCKSNITHPSEYNPAGDYADLMEECMHAALIIPDDFLVARARSWRVSTTLAGAAVMVDRPCIEPGCKGTPIYSGATYIIEPVALTGGGPLGATHHVRTKHGLTGIKWEHVDNNRTLAEYFAEWANTEVGQRFIIPSYLGQDYVWSTLDPHTTYQLTLNMRGTTHPRFVVGPGPNAVFTGAWRGGVKLPCPVTGDATRAIGWEWVSKTGVLTRYHISLYAEYVAMRGQRFTLWECVKEYIRRGESVPEMIRSAAPNTVRNCLAKRAH